MEYARALNHAHPLASCVSSTPMCCLASLHQHGEHAQHMYILYVYFVHMRVIIYVYKHLNFHACCARWSYHTYMCTLWQCHTVDVGLAHTLPNSLSC